MPQSHISMCVGALTLSLNERRFFMKNILQNKLFIVIFLFVILLFSFFNRCFASSSSDIVYFKSNATNSDITFKLPQGFGINYKYYFIYSELIYNGKVNYGVYISNSPFLIKDIDDETFSGIYSDGDFYFINYTYQPSVSTIDYSFISYEDYSSIEVSNSSYIGNSVVYHYYNSVSSTYKKECLNYTNNQIIDKDTGNVVFQGAPQKVEQVTIPKLETAQEIPQAMNKVLQMIIPIGLIVFLSGLLIYLVRLVILRMI